MATVGSRRFQWVRVEPLAHQVDLWRRSKPSAAISGATVAQQDPVEDGVGPGIGDPEVALVGLALDEVGTGRLGDDDVRNTEVPGEGSRPGS